MIAPKTNIPLRFFFTCFLILIFNYSFGQSGKDGARVISSSNTVVNDYTVLTSNANSGTTSLQVSNASLNSGFSTTLTIGDLIMIVQIQGASITTADDSSYGSISSYQNCGNHEFLEVASVMGINNIIITCPLQYNYSIGGRVQIVRVPRLASLTINSGGGITCPAWNGTKGGIVAIEVSGLTTINSGGSIDVSGRGFRGGSLLDNNAANGVLNFRSTRDDYGAEKGEGIAGSVIDYDLLGGRYCKGAPANGGGGANSHNAGGGGGSNSGNIGTYTGFGIPDISNAAWPTAWNLESTGFATSSSSGGGRGGYAFSDNNQNALVTGPTNILWGGDGRRESGGRGGRPLDYSSGKIFMGGGGGAGDQNNSKGGIGGNGGGMVFIISYSSISGAGQLVANGANGASTLTTNGTDGAGGGGGGGCVIINSTNPTTGISISANGGNGGQQVVQFFTLEAEGPGAGGGGGYISLTAGAPARSATGGNNGSTNSSSLSEFPPNGATKGAAGINNATLNTFTIIPQTINLCSSGATTISVSTTGTPPPGIIYYWYSQSSGGILYGIGSVFTTPILTSSQTFYVGSCPGTTRIPIQVNINTNLSPSFTASPVCLGNATVFNASGSAAISSWNWNFGNGIGTSTQQNPSYSYPASGSYSVTLTVGNGGCTASFSQSVLVSNAPVAGFTSSAPASGCGSLNVLFTNSTTGAASYSWNFGDGSPVNTLSGPSHNYSTAGSYTVVLTATGASCSSTVSHVISLGPTPLASFSSPNEICQNDTAFFTNLSVGNGSPIISQSWNFGDGSPASVSINPSHHYAATGLFVITLSVTTASCTDDTTISILVSPSASASFTTSATSGCTPLNVNFTNTSSGTSYSWNFGDGSPASTLTSPNHIYSTPGIYTVTLTATRGNCSAVIQNANLIQTTNSPLASFSAPASVCVGNNISFINSSTGNGSSISSYSWNFGDGTPLSTQANPVHSFLTAGIYSVKLTISTGACGDDTTININVSSGPIAAFSAPIVSGCGSVLVNFSNSSSGSPSYIWNFGDGSATSTLSSPTHNYANPGNYTVSLIASLGSCSDTIRHINYITVYNFPVSSFSALNVCANDSVRFNNLSSGSGNPLTTYTWDFGDGGISSSTSPSHLYSGSGLYNVHLTVSTAYCSDDTTVAISVSPSPSVSFSSSTTSACDSAIIIFTNASTGGQSYSWNFGDGTTSSLLSPQHNYNTPGQYSVLLTVSTTGGCSSSRMVLNMVNIYRTPPSSFIASANNICKGDCISFTGNSTSDVTSWLWTFSGAGTTSAAVQYPANICYPFSGVYNVTLQVSNGTCGSSHTEVAYINSIDCSSKPTANFISSDTGFCNGQCINFVDLSVNAFSWQWFFPGATPSSSNSEHPSNICYANPGTYSVTLIASNAMGSDTIVHSNFLSVSATPPTPSFAQNGDTLLASAGFQYQWYYNNIPLSGATSAQYVVSLSGPYSVSVTDANGCSAMSSSRLVSLVGIEETRNELVFYVFPNPVTNEFSIFLHSNKPLILTVSLYDVIGRKIMSETKNMSFSEEVFKYDVKNLTQGIYFLQIGSDQKKWIRSLIKQ